MYGMLWRWWIFFWLLLLLWYLFWNRLISVLHRLDGLFVAPLIGCCTCTIFGQSPTNTQYVHRLHTHLVRFLQPCNEVGLFSAYGQPTLLEMLLELHNREFAPVLCHADTLVSLGYLLNTVPSNIWLSSAGKLVVRDHAHPTNALTPRTHVHGKNMDRLLAQCTWSSDDTAARVRPKTAFWTWCQNASTSKPQCRSLIQVNIVNAAARVPPRILSGQKRAQPAPRSCLDLPPRA